MICLFCSEESIQLLLQIILEDSASAAGLEEDTAAWVRDYVHTQWHAHTQQHYAAGGLLFSTFAELILPCVSGGAIPPKSPGVQQAARGLEQVRWCRYCIRAVIELFHRILISE